jgi:plastocyanin
MTNRHRPHAALRLALALIALVGAAGCEAMGPAMGPAALTIVAENLAFTPQRVRLPVGVPIQVTLRNADGEIPHGLRVTPMRSGVVAAVLLETEVFNGPAERSFELPALQPGPYLFICPVHPTMQIEAEAG